MKNTLVYIDVQLIQGYTNLPELRTKVGVRLIHECDLYKSNYGVYQKISSTKLDTWIKKD